MYRISECRGRVVWDIPTADVQPGDKICAWLSDASAYLTVTGHSDRVLALSAASGGVLADVTHRTFTVREEAPWWCDAAMLTASLDSRVFILAREMTVPA